MAEKEHGNFLKKTKAAMSEMGQKAGEKLQNVKERAVPTAEKLAEKVKETSKNAATTLKEKVNTSKEASRKQKEEDRAQPENLFESKPISTRGAIEVIYYLMAADGEIFHSEEEKFNEIAAELDADFEGHKTDILNDCQRQMEKAVDKEDYNDVIMDGVEIAIGRQVEKTEEGISPKLLVWDLLSIAYSDESYDNAERKLIKYISRRLGIDKGIFLEMESSMLTMLDLERELNWVKSTDRPYLEIDAAVKEISKREKIVFDSIKDLVSL